MDEYVKINTIWKRDERGQIIEGDYATPEFAYLADVPWDWTEKVDGTNVRVGWDGRGGVAFGGRTANAQMPVPLMEHLRKTFTPEVFYASCIENEMVLYGEGFGAGIQSGGKYASDQTFVLFDVQVGQWWLDRENVADVARKLEIPVVPAIEDMTLRTASDLVKSSLTNPLLSAWGDFPMEGLVGRPLVDLFDRKGVRIMAKIKVKDFR